MHSERSQDGLTNQHRQKPSALALLLIGILIASFAGFRIGLFAQDEEVPKAPPMQINNQGNVEIANNLTVTNTISAKTVNVTGGGFGIIPIGGIIMWSGEPTNIPEGWALCDGKEYETGKWTPDLTYRFIRGSGNGVAMGAGGNDHGNTVTLQNANIPKHTHEYSDVTHTSDDISPNHEEPPKEGHQTQPRSEVVKQIGSGDTDDNNNQYYYRNVNTLVQNEQAEIEATPVDITPAYYALTFLMRVK